jgi:hypothetical protein
VRRATHTSRASICTLGLPCRPATEQPRAPVPIRAATADRSGRPLDRPGRSRAARAAPAMARRHARAAVQSPRLRRLDVDAVLQTSRVQLAL